MVEAQIKEKQYAAPYRHGGKKIMLMGINFHQEHRNLEAWKVIPDQP